MVIKLKESVKEFESVIFDFDGVIVDSNEVRTAAFREVLKNSPQHISDDLVEYHLANGGLSRYAKFNYIVEKYDIDKIHISHWLTGYSEYCRTHLRYKRFLISETCDLLNFLNISKKNVFIVSASDEKELKDLVDFYELPVNENNVYGSPKRKQENIEHIINGYLLEREKIVLIGDSINDFHAASDCNVKFIGFGNEQIIQKTNV